MTRNARTEKAEPPLVEPAAELTRDEVARYSRHLIIPDLGVDGQKRLKNARVLVIGAGVVGGVLADECAALLEGFFARQRDLG